MYYSLTTGTAIIARVSGLRPGCLLYGQNLRNNMLSKVFTTVGRTAKAPAVVARTGVRSFCEKLTIPTDKEQQAGRRKEELDAESAGDVGFNNEPIIPASNAGTKENPILVRIGLGLGVAFGRR